MATSQLKQRKRSSGRAVADGIRTVDTPLAVLFPMLVSGKTEFSPAERMAQLLPTLQTTLDVPQLLGLFHNHIRQIIPHDGVLYRYPNGAGEIFTGIPGKHSCVYRLVVEGTELGEITFSRDRIFSDAEIAMLESQICALVYPLRNGLSYKTAMDMARRDPLTGVYNRGVIEGALEREISLARRYHSPLSVIFMDIDHFKAVNDTFGHMVGDDVIREFSRCVSDKIRTTDILSRYGGDEFVAILPNTTKEGAELLAGRIRDAVVNSGCLDKIGLAKIGQGLKITTSIGVASLEENESAQQLLDRADRSLSLAKHEGRNCVRFLS